MPNIRILFFLLICVIISSCASQLPSPQRGDRDSGPTSTVDLDAIPDAIAKPVTRTKAGNYSPYTVLGKTYTVLPASEGFIEEGIASWYGRKFHGRLTSNGEKFDMYSMTAAHKHLPIPTYVEVTNLENGRVAILRVNDRGPFHGDRVIDLSWVAAAKLGFANKGTANVRVIALDPKDPYSTVGGGPSSRDSNEPSFVPEVELIPEEYALAVGSYYQVALLSQKERAKILAKEIEAYTKFPVRILDEIKEDGARYRLLIGPLLDRREANTLNLVLELAGITPGFITRIKD